MAVVIRDFTITAAPGAVILTVTGARGSVVDLGFSPDQILDLAPDLLLSRRLALKDLHSLREMSEGDEDGRLCVRLGDVVHEPAPVIGAVPPRPPP